MEQEDRPGFLTVLHQVAETALPACRPAVFAWLSPQLPWFLAFGFQRFIIFDNYLAGLYSKQIFPIPPN
ncbi:MAG: hypothetical protein AB7E77_03405 [Desulfobulbus sp.]